MSEPIEEVKPTTEDSTTANETTTENVSMPSKTSFDEFENPYELSPSVDPPVENQEVPAPTEEITETEESKPTESTENQESSANTPVAPENQEVPVPTEEITETEESKPAESTENQESSASTPVAPKNDYGTSKSYAEERLLLDAKILNAETSPVLSSPSPTTPLSSPPSVTSPSGDSRFSSLKRKVIHDNLLQETDDVIKELDIDILILTTAGKPVYWNKGSEEEQGSM